MYMYMSICKIMYILYVYTCGIRDILHAHYDHCHVFHSFPHSFRLCEKAGDEISLMFQPENQHYKYVSICIMCTFVYMRGTTTQDKAMYMYTTTTGLYQLTCACVHVHVTDICTYLRCSMQTKMFYVFIS